MNLVLVVVVKSIKNVVVNARAFIKTKIKKRQALGIVSFF